MFYLKASLIISAVSALPLKDLIPRQNNQLVSSELIPGSCSWQCGPTIAVANDCASDDASCVCTASAAYQLQYCLSCFVTQSSAGDPQPDASSPSVLTAVEWANNFNSQCREAGLDLPAVFVGGSSLERAVASTDNGSPAVPRVGSPPSATTSSPVAPAPAPVVTSSTPTSTPIESSSVTTSSASSSSLSSTPVPAPTSSPTPTPAASSSGLPSVITLGSQTITISSSPTSINIPGGNTSESSGASPDSAAAAQANTALRSMADVRLAVMVGTMSVIAAVMF